jgi:hypothetical protein
MILKNQKTEISRRNQIYSVLRNIEENFQSQISAFQGIEV